MSTERGSLDYTFEEAAFDDLLRIIDGYNDKRPGLGEELGDLVFEKLDGVLSSSPQAFVRHRRSPEVRIYPLRRFPVRILYRIESTRLLVVAFEHMRAQPDRWRARLLEGESDEV